MDLLKWMANGNCQFLAEDQKKDFFADADNLLAQARAKSHCAICMVRDECLSHAIDNREPFIWGGTTEHERGILRTRDYLVDWRATSSRNNIPHEQEHPTYASPSSLSRISFQQIHTPLVLSNSAEYEHPSPTHAPSSVVLQLLEGQSYHHNQNGHHEPSVDLSKIPQSQQSEIVQCEASNLGESHQSTLQNLTVSSFCLSEKESHNQSFSQDRIQQLQFPRQASGS